MFNPDFWKELSASALECSPESGMIGEETLFNN
jgi:hypothetical protein